jgi:hypothetical protein
VWAFYFIYLFYYFIYLFIFCRRTKRITKMDNAKASEFLTSLVKSVQALCNGYIDYNSTVQVIGHIHLNIDNQTEFDYMLLEDVHNSANEDAALFTSRSYYSKLPMHVASQMQNNSDSSVLCNNKRESGHIPQRNNNSRSSISSDGVIQSNNVNKERSQSSHSSNTASQPTATPTYQRIRKAVDTSVPAAKRACVNSSDSSDPALDLEVDIKEEPLDDSYDSNATEQEPVTGKYSVC